MEYKVTEISIFITFEPGTLNLKPITLGYIQTLTP